MIIHLVWHVSHLVSVVGSLFEYLGWRWFAFVDCVAIRPCISGFCKRALKDLDSHEYMITVSAREGFLYTFITQCAFAWSWIGLSLPGVHTRINWTDLSASTFLLTLNHSFSTDQITLAVSSIYQISGKSSVWVSQSIWFPLRFCWYVFFHEVLYIQWVHIFRIETWWGAENIAQVLHKPVKFVKLFYRFACGTKRRNSNHGRHSRWNGSWHQLEWCA